MNKNLYLITTILTLALIFACSPDNESTSKEITFNLSVEDNSGGTTCGASTGLLVVVYGFNGETIESYTNTGYSCGTKIDHNKKTTDSSVTLFTYSIISTTMPADRRIKLTWATASVKDGENLKLTDTCYLANPRVAGNCELTKALKF